MLGPSNWAASGKTAREEQHHALLYSPFLRVSSILRAHAVKTPIGHIQVVLGTILFALCWPTVTGDERAILLQCADGLERKLIDLRRGGVR